MSSDEKNDEARSTRTSSQSNTAPKSKPATIIAAPSWTDYFKIPKALKQVFDQYPLITYPVNKLPLRAPRRRGENVLYIFATPEIVESGLPSFNPGCLKWQTYLKFHSKPFRLVQSNNHASPSGALPFLQPAASRASPYPSPIPSNKLESWVHAGSELQEVEEAAAAAAATYLAPYHSLISHNIRLAYLHALYLHPPTFDTLATRLYIEPCSSNSIVQQGLSYHLRGAALDQILSAVGPVAPAVSGNAGKVDVAALERRADEAFEALSVLLGDAEWFSHLFTPESTSEARSVEMSAAGKQPGLLDAAVFAYTHVILKYFSTVVDASSPARRMVTMLEQKENLIRHCDRIHQQYYPSASISST